MAGAEGETVVSGTFFFEGSRIVKTPWNRSAMPQWTTTFSQLDYVGTSTISAPGLPDYLQNVSFSANPVDRKTNTVLFKRDLHQGVAPDVFGISGSGVLNSLWIGPDVLRTLRDGQTIDSDPITRIRVSISRNDGQSVLVTYDGPLQRGEITYDIQTGAAIRLRSTTTMIIGTRTDELALQKLP